MSKIFNISLGEVLRIAKLNKTETAIVNALKQSKNPLTVGRLIDSLRLERLVVFYNLKKLEKRGIVKCNSNFRAHTWGLASMDSSGTSVVAERNVTISDAYQALHNSAQQKLYGIQGAGAVKEIIKLIEKERNIFTKTHVRQKLRQVIIDGIITEKGVGMIKGMPKETIESHFGRPTILHVIPDNSFIDNYEIFSDGKLLVTVDYSRKIAHIDEDLNAVVGFLGLFETIKVGAVKKKPMEVYGEI